METESGQKTVAAPTIAAAAAPEAVTAYHWIVVILAACGWLFDCMSQRIFVLGREPAMRELLGAGIADDEVRLWGGWATCILMLGWATGGIIFGLLSDRYGRVKAMVLTLLAYSVFSAVSGFARNVAEFLFYRFLFGLGVGGMFGAATTLVAESVPKHFRTFALGMMQALSAFGNMIGSALSLKIIPSQENFWGHFSGWQVLFFAGMSPVILAIPILIFLREPEPWKKAKAEAAAGRGKAVGSIAGLFNHPRWRRSTLVGICLGVAGMVGLWGIGFFSPELISAALKTRPLLAREVIAPAQMCATLNAAANPAVRRLKEQLSAETTRRIEQLRGDEPVPQITTDALVADLNRVIQDQELYDAAAFGSMSLKKATKNLVLVVEKKKQRRDIMLLNRQLVEQLFPGAILELQKTIDKMRSRGTFLQDVGALFGMFAFTFAASVLNRRGAFLLAFILCLGTVSFVFYSLKSESDVYWMLPAVGFTTLSVFAGYSIYFPELFPTRLRGTGVGFCYNTVRYLTAPFPFLIGWLGTVWPFRNVAVTMCAIYLVGIVALRWAPETKGQPLPED